MNIRPLRSWTWEWLAVAGAFLVAAGIGALLIAATSGLLPQDMAWLHMTHDELCRVQDCRVLKFMVHDRVSFGGALVSLGLVYCWLAARPLARGEAWAWWTLALSGTAGFLSFLSYLGFGYLDRWHERATLVLLPIFVAGMVRARPWRGGGAAALADGGEVAPRGARALLAPAVRPARFGRLWLGRAGVLFAAFGMIAGGGTIVVLGSTRVFVPQDLEFMGIGAEGLRAISARLVPVIAHDRAGFGGALCSGGLAILFTAWCGIREGERALWWILAAAGAVGFGGAIGIHPVVGYLSLSHLAPALLGATIFLTGMAILYTPMCAGSVAVPASRR